MSSVSDQGGPNLARQIRRNERLFYLQLIWVTPFVVITGQYVLVLATRLGATPLLLGVLTSGSALALTGATVLSRWYVQRAPPTMPTLIVPIFVLRASVILIPLTLLLPSHQAEGLAVAVLLINVLIGVVQVTFYSFLPRVTLPERVAVLMGGRWTALGITMTIGTPLMALVLDHFPLPVNYAVAAGIGLVAAVIEVFNYAGVRLLPGQPRPPKQETALGDLRQVLKHAPAARFLAVTLVAQLALNAPAPLIPLKLVRELGASDADYGWYIAIYWLSVAAIGALIPRLVQMRGNRRLFALGSLGIGIQMLLLATAQSLPAVWVAGAIGGLATGLFQVTSFGQVVEYAPPGRYESYVSTQLSVVNFAVFAAPLVTSGLLSAGVSVGVALALVGAGNLLASTLSIGRHSHPPPS